MQLRWLEEGANVPPEGVCLQRRVCVLVLTAECRGNVLTNQLACRGLFVMRVEKGTVLHVCQRKSRMGVR